jgi:hypothetical protein
MPPCSRPSGSAPDECRRILSVSVALSEAEVHWRDFLESLVAKLAAWLEKKVPEGLAVFTPPEHHRRRLRTSNPMERAVQQELKRRTAKVRVFPSDESLLRLVSAIIGEPGKFDFCSNWQSVTGVEVFRVAAGKHRNAIYLRAIHQISAVIRSGEYRPRETPSGPPRGRAGA